MGRVECFSIEGVTCWFWSQDHNPPHFHAKKRGVWHFRVWFLQTGDAMLERVSGPRGRISPDDRGMLRQMAAEHRAELLDEWERKVKYDD